MWYSLTYLGMVLYAGCLEFLICFPIYHINAMCLGYVESNTITHFLRTACIASLHLTLIVHPVCLM
jgi:hypothetical protein